MHGATSPFARVRTHTILAGLVLTSIPCATPFAVETDAAFDLAERAIFAATHRDAYSGGTVRIYHIDQTGWHRIRETDSMDLYFRFQKEKEGK